MDGASNKSDNSKNRPIRTIEKLYFDRNETGDVKFIVESQKIRAHKSVLAAISPKYKAQFYGLQPDKDNIVVEDVSAAAFEEFLQFFYLEKVNFTKENIEDVLNLAKQSLVDDFIEDCAHFLSKNVDDPFLVHRLAVLYEIETLKQPCLNYISENTMKVFRTDDSLINCNRDMLLIILKLESLNCKETDIVEFCITWAKAVCRSKNMNDENITNVRAELGDAIYEIRFRSMTIEEFVRLHYLYDGLFTLEEMKEITYVIGNLENFKPSKFNQKLRNEDYENLQLNRIVYEEAIDKLASSIAPVTFSCNKNIRLNGFASGFLYSNNSPKLQIEINNPNDEVFWEEIQPPYLIQEDKETTIVTFFDAIDIPANQRVRISLDGPYFDIFTKYTLSKEVELKDYKFSFDTGDAPGILLTRLFFDRVN